MKKIYQIISYEEFVEACKAEDLSEDCAVDLSASSGEVLYKASEDITTIEYLRDGTWYYRFWEYSAKAPTLEEAIDDATTQGEREAAYYDGAYDED